MLRKTQMGLALSLAWGFTPALAQVPADDTVTQLKEITVSATRTERRVDKVPSTVTVTSSAKIEQSGARDIKDALRDELDVSVRAAAPRFTAAGSASGRAGNEGINIRGLEGNQVLLMVDGIRLPHSFSFGSFATGRGDFLDVDAINTVEVLRGPASTQFGSDGLAGAVSMQTLNADNLLKPGQSIAGFARASYATLDHSLANTLALAGSHGQWQALLLASYRQGHEVSNRGDNTALNSERTANNPLDYRNRYLLAKVGLALDARHKLGMTFETQRRSQDSEVYSARAVPPLMASSTLDLDTHDEIQRERVSIEHRFNDVNANWWQRVETRLYWQNAQVRQFSAEDRNTAPDRTRDNLFQSRVIGFSSLFESNFSGLLNQRLSYGIESSRSEVRAVRDGSVPPFGETFPTKPFPDTSYTLSGAFVQSEIEVGNVSLIPGLRFDHYRLAPSSTQYVGKLATLSDQALTPKFGLVWQFSPLFAPYAQWAQGFRAPSPDQVNNGFSNLASGYTSIGNPTLKAEHANSIELGVRGKLQGLRYSLAAFNNRYRDFISQQVVSGAGVPSNPAVYQYINLANARIHGWEARSEWQYNKNWHINLGLAYAKGDSESKGKSTPLDSIQPLKIQLGLRYDSATWGARAKLSYSAAKQADRVATVPNAQGQPVKQFATPASQVLDLGLHWRLQHNLHLNANLNNVFNRKYWTWSDASGIADSSLVKDAYTAAGRNAQLSVRYDF